MVTAVEVRALVKRHELALTHGDADGAAAHHAEDGVVESPSTGTQRGRTAIRDAYRRWFTAFPDFHFEVEDLVVDTNQAALFFRLGGTHQADFLNFPPTGKKVEVRGVMILRIEDDQIAHDRRIYDFQGFLVKLGVLKVKPV